MGNICDFDKIQSNFKLSKYKKYINNNICRVLNKVIDINDFKKYLNNNFKENEYYNMNNIKNDKYIYSGDMRIINNKEDFIPDFVDKDNKQYLFHGIGILKIKDQKSNLIHYKGEFLNGLPNGYGNLLFKDNSTFEGTFINDIYHGICNESNSIYNYKGEYLYGLKNNYGTIIYFGKNGFRYEGNFKNNSYNGKGKITYADGSCYEGDFINNLFDGYGIFKQKNNSFFEGNFKDGKKEGDGKLVYPDGEIIDGE